MKKILNKTFLKKYFIQLIIGSVLYGLMLLYISRIDLRAHVDALFVSGMLLFTVGWFIFVAHEGIFDVLAYGFVSFSKAIVNKRPNKTLDEYIYGKEPIDKSFYLSLWLSGSTFMIVSLILILFI